jgi:ribosomal protein S6
MKKYEGLFILNTAGKEEGIKDIIDKVCNEITALGGRIETTQKMDKRSFARVAKRRYNSGFYVNVIFEAQPTILPALRSRFTLNEDVFRVSFTRAPVPTK